jgi:uncharacterized protein YukJ
MPISDYGVLKGRAFNCKRATEKSEHFQILVNVGNDPHRIAINTKSATPPSQLLYFADEDFRHEITGAILGADLSSGFTPLASRPGGLALDFIRRNLFKTSEMKPLPSRAPLENDDLNDRMEFFTRQAIKDPAAVIYAFGQHWVDTKADQYFGEINPSKGIHDIHMNQGNPRGNYYNDNGPWQDGGLLFHFSSLERWIAVFTAFQSQAFHTDDVTGHPLNDLPIDDHNQPENQNPVRLVAAMVNPAGDDTGKEYVILLNKNGRQPINLNGWQLLDKLDNKDVISNKTIEAGGTLRINLSGKEAQLGNQGGTITLLDGKGLKVDGATFTKKDASNEGMLVEL